MTKRMMVTGVAFIAVAAVAACKDDKDQPRPTTITTTTSDATAASAAASAARPVNEVARGKYLVISNGCDDCHTPKKMGPNGPEPDMSLHLSGHPAKMDVPAAPKLPANSPWMITVIGTLTAWSGPWGTSYTANLTPDNETGTGKWTRQNFIDTIRNGRHMGNGRQILPPMPWPAFKNMTDEDLGAIYAYLKTIPAISNKVPEPRPPAGGPPGAAPGPSGGAAPKK